MKPMGKRSPVTKRVDSKGRITLGDSFANRLVIIEQKDDVIVLRIIPDREAWLYANPKALNLLRTGWREAREGKLVPGPDLGIGSTHPRAAP